MWRGFYFSLLLPGEGVVQTASCQCARCPFPVGYSWRASGEFLQPGMHQAQATCSARHHLRCKIEE